MLYLFVITIYIKFILLVLISLYYKLDCKFATNNKIKNYYYYCGVHYNFYISKILAKSTNMRDCLSNFSYF